MDADRDRAYVTRSGPHHAPPPPADERALDPSPKSPESPKTRLSKEEIVRLPTGLLRHLLRYTPATANVGDVLKIPVHDVSPSEVALVENPDGEHGGH